MYSAKKKRKKTNTAAGTALTLLARHSHQSCSLKLSERSLLIALLIQRDGNESRAAARLSRFSVISYIAFIICTLTRFCESYVENNSHFQNSHRRHARMIRILVLSKYFYTRSQIPTRPNNMNKCSVLFDDAVYTYYTYCSFLCEKILGIRKML